MIEKNNKYKICIFGAFLNSSNFGCRALAASLIKLIINSNDNAEINLLYGNTKPDTTIIKVSGKEVQVNVINCRMSPKAKIKEHIFWILLASILYRAIPFKKFRKVLSNFTPWIKKLEQADFVGDIRGGDSFSDIYGLQRIIFGSIPCIIAILLKKKLVLLPQTYGPFSLDISKYIAKFIFTHSKAIYARDKKSIEIVNEILGNNKKITDIRFCPDVAFTLDSLNPDNFIINPPLVKKNKTELIGINISGLLYIGGYTRKNMFGLKFEYKSFIEILIQDLLDKTNSEILLVPHTYSYGIESDYYSCTKIFNKLSEEYSGRIHVLLSKHDQNEIKGIIGFCDFFIGSRMHSCIAALSQGIPSVAIAYSRKFAGIFSSVGLEECVIDAREMTQEKVLLKCIEIYKNKENFRKILNEKIPQIKNDLHRCFKEEIFTSIS